MQTLDVVKSSMDISTFPNSDIDGKTPFFPNLFFGPMDALALAGMIRVLKPSQYVEIGSGVSTRVARHAVAADGLSTRIRCIDPQPRRSIDNVADEVIFDSLLNVDLDIFTSLSDNDILFFDGSHLVFTGTDCPKFFLEVLPLIPRGVYVHVHDIFLPDEYPERMKARFYNEQQLLAGFLYNNSDFQVVLPIQYLHRLGYCWEGVSFWIAAR